MVKPHTGLTTEPAPPPAQDDVAAARARLMAAEAAAVEAREAERARQRDRQIVRADEARELLKTLDPVRAALAAWEASASAGRLLAADRAFSKILLEQLDHPIRYVGTLQALLGKERTLNRLIGELGAPAVLAPAQLEAHVATLDGLRGQLAGIPGALATHRRLCAEAVTACEGVQRLLSEYIRTFTLPPAKGADT